MREGVNDLSHALGALLSHLATANPKGFQPMNVTYGLFPPLPEEKKRGISIEAPRWIV